MRIIAIFETGQASLIINCEGNVIASAKSRIGMLRLPPGDIIKLSARHDNLERDARY